jgi:hypothetical protein
VFHGDFVFGEIAGPITLILVQGRGRTAGRKLVGPHLQAGIGPDWRDNWR